MKVRGAIVIGALFGLYLFFGGDALVKTTAKKLFRSNAPAEKIANNQKVISIFDLVNMRAQEEVNNPVLLSIVEESRKNGFSFENDGTILFTLNKVDLKNVREPRITIPLKDVILDQIKIDKSVLTFLRIEYFYSKEKGKSYLRFTADVERYFGKIQLNYRTGEKIISEILFYPPG